MSLTCSTTAPTTTDQSVLTALSCGDAAAWEETVRRFEGLLRSSARAVLRNDADIDEAVQRTWVLLFRHADRIHDAACLPGWLSTTARREALAVLRSQQRAVPTEDVGERMSPMLREEQTYDTLSRELEIPRGSLGPLRGRAVRALRAQLEPSLR